MKRKVSLLVNCDTDALRKTTLSFRKQCSELAMSRQSPLGIEVAPNGFYIDSQKDELHQTLLRLDSRRASFSALSNAAASPKLPSTSQSRQRQLISGRKFSDILEACRPGTTHHAMPSALSSLLTLHEVAQKQNNNRDRVGKQTIGMESIRNDHQPGRTTVDEPCDAHPASSLLKEWGAVDFDALDSILSQSPSNLGVRRLHDAGTSVPRDQMSDRSSPTSSFTSHLSNLMSRSLERGTSLHSYGGGFQLRSRSMVDGIQMQRSPSMDSLETSDGGISDSGEPDDSLILEEDEEAVESNFHPKKQTMNEAEYLRKLMKRRDRQFFERNRSIQVEQKPENTSIHTSDDSVDSGGTTPISK